MLSLVTFGELTFAKVTFAHPTFGKVTYCSGGFNFPSHKFLL
jgi:hypothetical protein